MRFLLAVLAVFIIGCCGESEASKEPPAMHVISPTQTIAVDGFDLRCTKFEYDGECFVFCSRWRQAGLAPTKCK